MKISQLSKLAGISTKTIRYYEEVGLVNEPARTASGYRDYRDNDVERLVFIRRCRELNMSIEEIKHLLHVQLDSESSCESVDNLIIEKLSKVRATIKELKLLEKTLNELAHACRNNSMGNCKILQHLNG